MGVLAPWDVPVEITGDESLQRRPMRRITAPLMKMGARFEPGGRETLPITEVGTRDLRAITYDAGSYTHLDVYKRQTANFEAV